MQVLRQGVCLGVLKCLAVAPALEKVAQLGVGGGGFSDLKKLVAKL